MDYTHKLHLFIAEDLPEYIRVEYPRYVEFLEAYYRFLDEPENANALLLGASAWRDIDTTLDAFIPQFRSQYAWDLPEGALVRLRHLLKYINQYYDSKGTENAAELLFRMLFDVNATESYPGMQMLRASDGEWSRKRFVKLDTTQFPDADAFALSGKTLVFEYLEFIPNIGNVPRSAEVSCFGSVGLSDPNIYLLDVDLDPDYTFPDIIKANPTIAASMGNYDSHIYVKYDGEYYGSLSVQLTGVLEVVDRGEGFRVGDSFNVDGAVVRINRLRSPIYAGSTANILPGEIDQIQLLTTGFRFDVRETIGLSSYFAEDYVTDSDDYASDAEQTVPVEYVSETLTPNGAGEDAEVRFRIGYLFVSAGQFMSNRGFSSDIVALQDNKYYQPFSYVIKTPLSSDVWRDVYLKSNHPAGFKMFAEVALDTTVLVATPTISTSITPNIFIPVDTIQIEEDLAISYTEMLVDTINLNNYVISYFAEDYVTDSDDYSSEFYEAETIIFDLTETEWEMIANDTFTDTDATAISSHTPDLGFSGWVQPASGGTFVVNTNQALQTTGPFSGRRHVVTTSAIIADDFRVSLDIIPSTVAGAGDVGVHFRGNGGYHGSVVGAPLINGFDAIFSSASGSGAGITSNFVLVRWDAGVATVVNTWSTLAVPNIDSIGRRVVVEVFGNDVNIEIQPAGGGAAEHSLSYTIVGTSYSTNEYFGIRHGGSNIARRYDNFIVEEFTTS